jgi:hypothetical protein
VSTAPAAYVRPGPNRSFREEDAGAMVPGVVSEMVFPMLPTSVRIEAGHRLRIALSGADKNTFAQIPAEGPAPKWRLHRGDSQASGVLLPMRRV